MLLCLQRPSVEFVLVGAHALAAHGIARATGDIDIFVRPSPANATRVVQALVDFGAPIAAHNIGTHDFTVPGTVSHNRSATASHRPAHGISGVPFNEAWSWRLEANVGGMQLAFLGKEALIKNKLAAGRDKVLSTTP